MKQPVMYIVSDSVGETAELVVKAAATQFASMNFQFKRIPYVEERETLADVIALAKLNEAIIAFTLVVPELRFFLLEEAKKQGVMTYDIIGPLIEQMETAYGLSGRQSPGRIGRLDDDYFRRIEAIEFAVKYDDGRDPRGILRADIVLIGVSRTSKTPLSQYLANKRYKVANVPIVPEVDPPAELFKVDPNKCFGLKISPDQLNSIRIERLKALGLDDTAIYANITRIKEEIVYFDKIVDQIHCDVIDVTNKAVEETANLILNTVSKRNFM